MINELTIREKICNLLDDMNGHHPNCVIADIIAAEIMHDIVDNVGYLTEHFEENKSKCEN